MELAKGEEKEGERGGGEEKKGGGEKKEKGGECGGIDVKRSCIQNLDSHVFCLC